MLAEISAGLGSLKAAFDITKGLNAANTQASINEVKIELQQLILDAQQALSAANDAQSASANRIAQLENQIAAFEDWKAEKQRYQLKAIDRGAFAYVHKPGMEQDEPAMWLCQACFEKRHRSPLQYIAQDRGSGAASGRGTHARWGCNLCKTEVVVDYRRKPSAPYEGDGSQPSAPAAGFTTTRVVR